MTYTIQDASPALEVCREAVQGFNPALKLELTGSVYILGEGQDIDVLCECLVDQIKLLDYLCSKGWRVSADGTYEASFYSLRKDGINLIVVADAQVFRDWLAAAELCKVLGVVSKEARVCIHECVKFRYDAETIRNLPYPLTGVLNA